MVKIKECKYRLGVDCEEQFFCKDCGWNPAVERKRKIRLGCLDERTDKQIIADQKKYIKYLEKVIDEHNIEPHTLAIKWI